MEQGSEAWHELKLGRFSGTRLGNIQSGKSTASYQNTIAEVAAEIITQSKEDSYVNADMERGIDLEPEAAKEYELITGYSIKEVGFIEPENDLAEWTGISPDRLVEDNGGLEIKCPKVNTHFNYIKAGKLPNTYKWQVQGALWVTKLEWWDFMSYYPKLKPFIIRVYPDLEMHEKIETELEIAKNAVKEMIEMYNNYEL
jgi:hypothetical protein